ncbi:MAG: tetratricopeptide repeat protein [Polyangia bacterium]
MLRGIVAAALVCALAGIAFADNKEAAKESYSEGKRHYDLGEYDAALAAFKKAYLNYEEPVFLFNIAQCYRALGDRPGAVRSYRAFLRNWPKAPNREQVERIVAELEAAIAQDATAKAAPPQDTLPPGKPPETAKPKPAEPAHAEAQPKPAAPVEKPAPPPAVVPEPKPAVAAKPAAPSHDELAGMVEVEPNFDRPSGSAKPLKWWAWTLIAVGIGGIAAAAAVIAVTQSSSSKFDSTLPTFNVQNQTLRSLQVRF